MSQNKKSAAVSLTKIMCQEITLLEEFRCKEETLRQVIKTSNWEALSDLMEEMGRIADWIDTTEEKRNQAFEALCGPGQAIPFYQAISDLPDSLRVECAELYRSLKFSIVKIKGLTWSLDSHIRSVSDTMHTVLNELFPYRKGRLYSRRGTAKSAETEPLVVNHQL